VFLWIYDIPTWLLAVIIVGTFTLLSVAGLYATRRLIRWLMGPPPHHNEFVDAYVHVAVLLYGLIAGLVAVAAWEQRSTVDDKVSQEASSLAALYRDVSTYPQPWSTRLTHELRDYTVYVINVAWPQQREGIIPAQGVQYLDAVGNTLYAYEPKTEGQRVVHAAALEEFNRYVELRRSRLHEVSLGLPPALWIVIVTGGIVTILLTYFLALDRFRVHVIMTIFAAVMVSLLIFMIAVVDHPLRGEVGVGPDAFQLVYKQLMAGH
jgi:hypothetical protein